MDRLRTFSPSPTPSLTQSHSRSLSRSRPRITDDILSDLSPTTTFEAFTSPSGRLKASIEAATQSERAFGLQASLASKKIKEWVQELSNWPWPAARGSDGFEMPEPKRRKLSQEHEEGRNTDSDDNEYIGSLLASQVNAYEIRLEEISIDMDDLNVEEIKHEVLATTANFTSTSRISSTSFHSPQQDDTAEQEQQHLVSYGTYTAMDDFTAIITATVLKALPNLSRLMRLMDVWSMRLIVLRKIPPLLEALDDAELALASAWKTIETPKRRSRQEELLESVSFDRQSFNVIRDTLRDRVAALGRHLDFMLDTLEGWDDTLPDEWLDRMEKIENDYGEWVVAADRRVREEEWRRQRQAEMERRKQEEEARKREEERIAEENRKAEKARLAEEARKAEEIRIAEEARKVEDARLFEEAQKLEEARLAEEAIKLEEARLAEEARKLEKERKAEQARQAESDRLAEEFRLAEVRNAEEARLAEEAGQGPIIEESMMEMIVGDADDLQGTTQTRRAEELTTPILSGGKANEPAEAEHSPHSHDSDVVGAIQSAMVNNISDSALEISEELPAVVNKFGRLHLLSDLEIEPDLTVSSGTDMSSSDNDTPDSDSASAIAAAPIPVDYPWNNESNSFDSERSQDVSNVSEKPRLDVLASSSNVSLNDQTVEGNSNTEELPSSQSISMQATEKVIDASQHSSANISVDQENEWIVIHSPGKTLSFSADGSTRVNDIDYTDLTANESSGDLRRLSYVSSHSTSSSIPQILEEEPAEFFHPVSTPIRSPRPIFESSSPNTPAFNPPLREDFSRSVQSADGRESSLPPVDEETEYDTFRTMHLGNFNFGANASYNEVLPWPRPSGVSPGPLMTPAQIYEMSPRGSFSHRGSVSSNASTVIISRPANIRISRMLPDNSPSPISDRAIDRASPIINQQSPLAGRFGSRGLLSHDYTPPGSPKVPAISPKKYLHVFQDESRSQSPDSPGPSEASFELPILPNVDMSTDSALPSPTKAADDQMQQQISEILQSIPAHIRLTSELDTTQQDLIQPKKTRRVLTPSVRPHSSMSNTRSYSSMSNTRSSTPSFTLRPAPSTRPRAQSGVVSETRLYHLSRTTGEAPIKLFVRLVGENGERVMVRVGGGWADFGEYLKEYAAHHRRRSFVADDKVEIQDIPSRNVSSSSMMSTPTVRNGRASPASRPGSALDRPTSSLAVRKTRRSEGEGARDTRPPSTPMLFGSRRDKWSETPGSAVSTASSSSRLSWTEEDSSLGLAGPNSKKVDISARDQEWVESMKDKVRKASAEKEKRHVSDFGVLGKVGGTKRLFRKG
ncbi:hypothetical protein B7463_g9645, partial [Scytalidium lignicola]